MNNNIIKILILSSIVTFCFAGDIQGKISFDGKAPKMKSLRMDADPVCVANNTVVPRREWLILDENNGIKNVLVFVKESSNKSLEGEFNAPENPAVIDQNGCVYVPHVLGIQTGQNLNVLNSDGTTHNINPSPAQNRDWNISQAPNSDPIVKKFARAEIMIPIKCNVHPWMKSYLGVVSHPYFTVTGADGSFELKGLPPGEYTVESWHEKLGVQKQTVTVLSGEAQATDFSYGS